MSDESTMLFDYDAEGFRKFADFMRARRLELGITQAQVWDRMYPEKYSTKANRGINVSAYEWGEHVPSPRVMRLWCTALGVTPVLGLQLGEGNTTRE